MTSFAHTGLVTFLTGASLLAVFVPLYRGLRLCFAARAATRAIPRADLKDAIKSKPVGSEPLALTMLRAFVKSIREADRSILPSEFALDASKQYTVNEYESHYANLISMYANLLPPIGFIGTTTGMLILFASMHLSNTSLQLGALAIALLSSIFALIGFALLEALKIRLYGRLLHALDEVAALRFETAGGPGTTG